VEHYNPRVQIRTKIIPKMSSDLDDLELQVF